MAGRFSGRRQLGCGAIAIAMIGALVFGIDPGQMLGTMEGMQDGAPTQQQQGSETAAENCDDNQTAIISDEANGR